MGRQRASRKIPGKDEWPPPHRWSGDTAIYDFSTGRARALDLYGAVTGTVIMVFYDRGTPVPWRPPDPGFELVETVKER